MSDVIASASPLWVIFQNVKKASSLRYQNVCHKYNTIHGALIPLYQNRKLIFFLSFSPLSVYNSIDIRGYRGAVL